jgi:sulfite exporter TauE/SafE
MTRFLIGTANGLLPCGFVYLALAAALATGDYLESAGYMFFFGLGTLPMMFGFSYAGSFFGPRFLKFFRKATPYLALLVGILLIYRGIYVVNHSCCHK